MKLGTARQGGRATLYGQLTQGWYQIERLARVLGPGAWDAPPTMEAVLQQADQAVDAILEWLDRAERQGIEPDAEPIEWLAPVPRPGNIWCVGLNYRPHIAESNMTVPACPVLFNKAANAVIGSGATIHPPAEVTQLDYEAELVMVIGRRCAQVSEEQALRYVLGYCNGNDISARDLQFRTSQWSLGKSADGFAPMGPYLVVADAVRDPNGLAIVGRRNGEVVQQAHTGDMIFSCRYLISYLSRYVTLEPGDVIFTGTPEGVILGQSEDRRQWLRPGDVLTVSIEGLGDLVTRIGAPRGL